MYVFKDAIAVELSVSSDTYSMTIYDMGFVSQAVETFEINVRGASIDGDIPIERVEMLQDISSEQLLSEVVRRYVTEIHDG